MREFLIIGIFYGLYTLVRDLHGENPTSIGTAMANARRVISIERHVGIFDEARIQQLFVHNRPFIEFWDGYYGTLHFVAVIAVLGYLFLRYPMQYRRWRNTLAATTGLALIGFAFFPLLPPRLLPVSFGFTDTLHTVGGLWDFSSGAVDEVSNQFAAMPSLHTGWSLWCALALLAVMKPLWGRVLVLLYPLATVFCIIITANHYFLDAAGGAACLAAGYSVARLGETAAAIIRRRRAPKPHLVSVPTGDATAGGPGPSGAGAAGDRQPIGAGYRL